MNRHCFFTSFNRAYAAQAAALCQSLRDVYGRSIDIVALLVDELDDQEAQFFAEFDQVILARDLDVPDFRNWIFGLEIVEAATALKPFALSRLLPDYDAVIYADPDTYFYSGIAEAFEALVSHDIVLTPHQLTPSTERWVVEACEMESLRYGVYNLGFIGVKNSLEGRRFAQWWSDRCYDYCVVDYERGLFTDQKLIDLVPAFFPGSVVLRHAGYNVATWNVRERDLAMTDVGVVVNGLPLRFCHFTKATHIGAYALERMTRSFGIMDELFYAYLAYLADRESQLLSLHKYWAYGRYSGGANIDGRSRKLFRTARRSGSVDFDPFRSPDAVEAFIRDFTAS